MLLTLSLITILGGAQMFQSKKCIKLLSGKTEEIEVTNISF